MEKDLVILIFCAFAFGVAVAFLVAGIAENRRRKAINEFYAKRKQMSNVIKLRTHNDR